MLNVMLVDDESLVRAGLKHGFPWEQYGMRVVAEANSVRKAIETLEACPDVDLVFTDVVMPGGNGLELVSYVKREKPMLPVVMLSHHDDFSYIQEALRLGAVDYIHKTEFERPDIAKTLRRIADAAEQSRENRDALGGETPRYVQALIVTGMSGFTPPEGDLRLVRVDETTLLMLFPEPRDERFRVEMENQLESDALLMFFDGIEGVRIPDILYSAKRFMNQEYFYRKLPNLRIYDLDVARDDVVRPMLDPKVYAWIETELTSLNWLGDDALFLKILSTIQRCRLSPDIVSNLFFGVRIKWRHVLPERVDEAPFQRFKYWYQWADWIAGLRRQLISSGDFFRDSPVVVAAMQRLMVYLDSHFTDDITVARAAEMTSLSESYFAKCFRRITRKSFHNYLRDMRLAYARNLLTSTRLSVARVGELSGFPDPFHFIKLFKSRYAMPPGQYRAKWLAQTAREEMEENQ